MSRLLAVLLLAATAAAAEPPLPDGAVARLGSARSRIAVPAHNVTVTISPDGKHLAVADLRALAILDATTGRLEHLLPLPDKQYPSLVRFLDDGKRVAVGATDGRVGGQVTIFDLAEGKPRGTYKLPARKQLLLADMTPDGSRVLAVDWFEKVYLWDLAAGREVWSFPHERPTRPRQITADGKYVVMTGDRQQCELRDAATGKLIGPFPDPGPRFRNLYMSAMAPDGRLAVGSNEGNAVAILSARGENRVRVLPAPHYVEQMFFSPDGRYLVATGDRRSPVWDLSAPDDKGPVTGLGPSTGGGFAPDGKTIVLTDEGTLTFWSVGTWQRVPPSADPPSPVYRVWFDGDGTRVIGYTRLGWVSWPAAGGPMTRLSDDGPGSNRDAMDVTPDGRLAADLVFEPGPSGDGGRESSKLSIRITALTSGKTRRIPVANNYWQGLRFSPDGRFLTAIDRQIEHVVWDVTTGAEIARTKWPDGWSVVFGVASTDDGQGRSRSVVGRYGKNARGFPFPTYSSVAIIDHATGSERPIDPVPWMVYSNGVRFSANRSRLMLIGRYDEDFDKAEVSVWDAASGRRLMRRLQGSGRSESIGLSADGRSLITGTLGGHLALVEVATGGERVTFRHRAWVTSAAFHPDGTKLVSSSPEAPVYVWDLLRGAASWDPAKADAVWADLIAPDAKVAYAAIRTLRANPKAAVAFLKDRVKLPAPPDDETLSKWIKGLDAPAFAQRERAQRELTAVADLVRPKLEAARKGATEEAGRRLDQVLKAAEELSPANLRRVRACELLEGIGTAEAMAVLQIWSAGPAGARLTIEATESVARRRP